MGDSAERGATQWSLARPAGALWSVSPVAAGLTALFPAFGVNREELSHLRVRGLITSPALTPAPPACLGTVSCGSGLREEGLVAFFVYLRRRLCLVSALRSPISPAFLEWPPPQAQGPKPLPALERALSVSPAGPYAELTSVCSNRKHTHRLCWAQEPSGPLGAIWGLVFFGHFFQAASPRGRSSHMLSESVTRFPSNTPQILMVHNPSHSPRSRKQVCDLRQISSVLFIEHPHLRLPLTEYRCGSSEIGILQWHCPPHGQQHGPPQPSLRTTQGPRLMSR